MKALCLGEDYSPHCCQLNKCLVSPSLVLPLSLSHTHAHVHMLVHRQPNRCLTSYPYWSFFVSWEILHLLTSAIIWLESFLKSKFIFTYKILTDSKENWGHDDSANASKLLNHPAWAEEFGSCCAFVLSHPTFFFKSVPIFALSIGLGEKNNILCNNSSLYLVCIHHQFWEVRALEQTQLSQIGARYQTHQLLEMFMRRQI